MWMDARIPVRFGPLQSRTAGEAVLTDANSDGPGAWAVIAEMPGAHPPDCVCCLPRSGAAIALGTLFRLRATTADAPFRAVLAIVGPVNEAAVRAALTDDPVAAARFRLAAS